MALVIAALKSLCESKGMGCFSNKSTLSNSAFLLTLTLCIASMIGCDGAPNVPGTTKQFKAKELFTDVKVVGVAEALESNDLAKAGQLLHAGADINAVGKDGMTLPIWTMMLKNKSSFTWLFEHGANPNLVPKDDRGVLLWACAADDSEWLDILLRHKADVNLQRRTVVTLETPLSEAIFGRHRKNLELLIKADANVNAQRPVKDGGGTPLINAANSGWFEGVYVLLEAGADYRPRTAAGDDVTYLVVKRDASPGSEDAQWKAKVLQLLKERGADIEAAQKRADELQAQDRRDRPWLYKNEK